MKSTPASRRMLAHFIHLVILSIVHVSHVDGQPNAHEERGPMFAVEPSGEVSFANTKGALVKCTATGTPKPTVQWILADGSPVSPVQGLRDLDTNSGILTLQPFLAEQYRPDVHAVTYKCAANNSFGKILSTDVQVRGVVLQAYDVQVYDSFAIEGNTALFKCHIPSVLADFIEVTAWIRNDNLLINSADSAVSDKYVVTPTGELHVTNVEASDSNSIYKCKTTQKLSNESSVSKIGGRLYITAPHGNVATKIIDLRTNVEAAVGEFAVMACVAQGFPVPRVLWYRKQANGMVTEIVGSSRYKLTKTTLGILNVETSDGGGYICEVISSLGKDQAEILLTVNEPLQIDIKPKLHTARANEHVAFICELTGGSTHSFTWLHNGRIIPSATGSSLSISNVEAKDSGMYQCFAKLNKKALQATAELRLSGFPPKFLQTFQEVTAQPGEAVRLECSAVGTPVPNISWDLDGMVITENERMQVTHRFGTNGNVASTMVIQNAKVEDGGVYTCTVANPEGKSQSSARVNIFGTIQSRFVANQMAVAGSDVYLNCPYYGHPAGDIQWEKDDTPLPSTITQFQFKNGTLHVSNVQKSSDAGTYLCFISTNDGKSVQSQLELNIFVPPKIVPFAFQDDHLLEGNLARVSCVISRGDLPLNIRWEKDGEAIPSNLGVAVKSFDEHSSILSIESVSEKHNGLYACIASNAAGVVNYSAPVLVQVPPHWLIKPENTAVTMGQDVTIHCQAGGYPIPVISWKHSQDYSRVRHDIISNTKFNVFANGSLLIRKIDNENAGNYLCLASNGIKNGISTTIKLRIKAPPTFKQQDLRNHVAIGQEFTLKCECEGEKPISVVWYKDGNQMVQTSNKKYDIASTNLTSGLSSVLTLFKTVREDNGKYECRVSNDHGHNNMTFNLVIEESPEPPKDIKVSVHGSRMMELSWQQAFDGNLPITKYIIEYITEFNNWGAATILETASGEILVGIVANLQPATNYLFRMYAENVRGRSKPSSIIKGTTIEEAPSSVPIAVRVKTNNDNMLTVTWDAPEDSSQERRITGYYIGFKEEGSVNSYTYKTYLLTDPPVSDYSIDLANLKKLTKYAIVVQAYNEQGKGPLSNPVVAMTSEGVPHASPLNVRCTTLTSESIHVAWSLPPSNVVNGILSGYKVAYKAATGWYAEDELHFLNSNTTSATIKDLEKYTNYTIQVSAATKVGEGPFSSPISCKTLDDEPGAPAEIKVLAASENSVLLTWKHPLKPNGVIKSFNAYFRDVSVRNDVIRNTLPAKLTQLELPGLTKGKRYEFWVTASTLVGEGASSPIVALTLNSVSVPARVVPFDEKVIVPWKSDISLSCQAVGIPLPERKWYYRDEEVLEDDRIRIIPDGSLTIKGVQEEHIGDYYCVVSNEMNEDRVTYTLIILVPPSPPTVEVMYTTSNSIEIRWRMSRIGSDSVKGYILHVRREFGEWEEIPLDPDVASYRLNGLECGTKYELVMAAFNKIGLGDKSQPLLVSTNGSVPGAPPKMDLLEETATSISISLNAWKVHGCPILYYIIEYKQKGSEDWIFASNNAKPEQMRLVVRDLTPASWYRLRMTAHSSAGSSVAEYDFATLLATGGTISPDVMLQDQHLNSSSSPQVDLWVVIVIILSLLLLVVGVALVSMFIKRRRSEQCNSNAKGHRLSSASSVMVRDGNASRFSYSHRNTLSRPHTNFNTMSSAGCQDDPIPYATCQLGSHNFGTLQHHGICAPVHPCQIAMAENFNFQNRMMMDNGNFAHLSHSPAETTMMFPDMHGGCTNASPSHLQEDLKEK